MWQIEYSTSFKKDLKKVKRQRAKLEALRTVLIQLRETGTVSRSFNPHMLSGNYSGCLECHIQNDFLLIWKDANSKTIKLIRLGSHSELFK